MWNTWTDMGKTYCIYDQLWERGGGGVEKIDSI